MSHTELIVVAFCISAIGVAIGYAVLAVLRELSED